MTLTSSSSFIIPSRLFVISIRPIQCHGISMMSMISPQFWLELTVNEKICGPELSARELGYSRPTVYIFIDTPGDTVNVTSLTILPYYHITQYECHLNLWGEIYCLTYNGIFIFHSTIWCAAIREQGTGIVVYQTGQGV